MTRPVSYSFCKDNAGVNAMMLAAYLCKDNANREENEMNSFISYPEMQLILCKDNANREQYKPNLFGFIAEMQLILCKDNCFLLNSKNVY